MCPNCRSISLRIKKMTRWERIMVILTDKRKYSCKDCSTSFRATDRRKGPREGDAIVGARAAGLLRGSSR